MLRIYADFNSGTKADEFFILRHDRVDGPELATETVKNGDRVILFQDEDDFEVEAVIFYRFIETLEKEAWVAVPDWKTVVRF
jgi:hypothetical protein